MGALGREPRRMEEKSYAWVADMQWEIKRAKVVEGGPG
jgi:hypothetical protein